MVPYTKILHGLVLVESLNVSVAKGVVLVGGNSDRDTFTRQVQG